MYDFTGVEKKWQFIWQEAGCFSPSESIDLPNFYILEMFPYPSGKIHVGHIRNYAIGDAIARLKKNQQFNVLHPWGWDSFGLPAENAAIEQQISPETWTYSNISQMREDIKKIGLSVDWQREIITSDPEYYKHEQAFFIDMYKQGLAYKKTALVNWDPKENTVLANEQVIDGKGWRSGVLVEQKQLEQWFIKITDFTDELLSDLDKLSNWPKKVITMQKNWIGKSTGVVINFHIENSKNNEQNIEIFTTKPHTIFGATFVAVAPNHILVRELSEQNDKIREFYRKYETNKRQIEKNEESLAQGINLGIQVKHPLLNKLLPVFAANFVLPEYGSGAVFGTPAHDKRDFKFAQNHNLEIIRVIDNCQPLPFVEDEGIMCNSSLLDGMSIEQAKDVIIKVITTKNIGREIVNYRLRDWGVSRQRYWGCPIPMIKCPKCGIVPEKLENLPITLPKDIDLTANGNPLNKHPTWKHTKCPNCNTPSLRETDTLDTFFESSWYFLKYTTADKDVPFTDDSVNRWLPVNIYIGGIEHAILHLLYSRFFVKALKHMGYFTNIDEPFDQLITQGMICHKSYKDSNNNWVFPNDITKDEHGNLFHKISGLPVTEGPLEKMSKSKKNVINPDAIYGQYGADSVRLFVLSDSPPTKDLEWTDEGIVGSYRFINKLYDMHKNLISIQSDYDINNLNDQEKQLLKFTHQTIKGVTENINTSSLNKAIALCRELYNLIEDSYGQKLNYNLIKNSYSIFIQLIYPFIPHVCEEIWQNFGNKQFLANNHWPQFDPKIIENQTVTLPVQIMGKTRGFVVVNKDIDEKSLLSVIIQEPQLSKYVANIDDIKKVIYVPNKIINLIV